MWIVFVVVCFVFKPGGKWCAWYLHSRRVEVRVGSA